MVRFRLLSSILLSAFLAAIVFFSDEGRAADTTTVVRFKAGSDSASYQGVVAGYDTARYLIDARAGQRMNVILNASNPQAYFNVLPPGSSNALFDGSISGSSYSGSLPKSGSYVIEVYLMRAAARRGETSRYSLSIAIPAGNNTGTRPPDYADGNAGGPDNWVVSGIASNDRLNVRASPSPSAEIVGRLNNGVVVRNLGCQIVNESRWCRISTRGDIAVHGWANGRFLVEGGSPSYPPNVSGGQIRDTKCKVNSFDCIRKAEQKCNGSFRTIYSESHAGGIVDDKVPGPIIWYYLEYQCGPSNGRPPKFPFRGAYYEPGSSLPGSGNAGSASGQAVMRDTCRNAAASAFGQRSKNVLVLPVENTGDGYTVYGQYPERGSNVTTFTCRFKRDGTFRNVKLD